MSQKIDERLAKVETDLCWIKKMLQRIDARLTAVRQDLDSTKLRVMALASGVSVIISIIIDILLR